MNSLPYVRRNRIENNSASLSMNRKLTGRPSRRLTSIPCFHRTTFTGARCLGKYDRKHETAIKATIILCLFILQAYEFEEDFVSGLSTGDRGKHNATKI